MIAEMDVVLRSIDVAVDEIVRKSVKAADSYLGARVVLLLEPQEV